MTTSVGTILILSDEPVIAALVGTLVELTGATPAFAKRGEQATDAMQRFHPPDVMLLDAEMDAARSNLFFALAAQKAIEVVVFGSEGRAREVAEVAAQRRIPWLTLPPIPRAYSHCSAVARRKAKTAGSNSVVKRWKR